MVFLRVEFFLFSFFFPVQLLGLSNAISMGGVTSPHLSKVWTQVHFPSWQHKPYDLCWVDSTKLKRFCWGLPRSRWWGGGRSLSLWATQTHNRDSIWDDWRNRTWTLFIWTHFHPFPGFFWTANKEGDYISLLVLKVLVTKSIYLQQLGTGSQTWASMIG